VFNYYISYFYDLLVLSWNVVKFSQWNQSIYPSVVTKIGWWGKCVYDCFYLVHRAYDKSWPDICLNWQYSHSIRLKPLYCHTLSVYLAAAVCTQEGTFVVIPLNCKNVNYLLATKWLLLTELTDVPAQPLGSFEGTQLEQIALWSDIYVIDQRLSIIFPELGILFV